MKRAVIPLMLLFLLAIEGVAMELLPSSIKYASFYITPHWLLLFLILVIAYVYPVDATVPIIYAAISGLMIDIVYTGVLGVYMFVLAIAVYVAYLLNRLLQANFLMIALIALLSMFVMEVSLFAIYTMLGFLTMSVKDFFLLRFIPTIIANLLFIAIIYYPSKQLLLWTKDSEQI